MLYLWLNVLLAFIVGAFWIAMASTAADRFGSKLGGLIGGMPSMIMIALVFIGLSQGITPALETAYAFPIAYGATVLFLLAYAVICRRNQLAAMGAAFAIWIAISTVAIAFRIDDPVYGITFYLITYLFCYIAMVKVLKIPSLGKATFKSTTRQRIVRSILGGAVIAFVVFVSRVAGPVYGGIFGGFPIVFSSLLIISYKTGGAKFSRAIAKSLALTGISTTIYIVAIIYLYPAYGVVAGTISGYLITILCGALIYKYLKGV
ncbi:MAG: DUF3147 family protein [Candidatus Micrarchaeota archaeon]|nr:DUF3147 family protein [Candidatus Micrarchaeota archaeon]